MTAPKLTYTVEALFEGEWLAVDVGLSWAEAIAVQAYHRDHGTEARIAGFCADMAADYGAEDGK